jgi:hypothetical protein
VLGELADLGRVEEVVERVVERPQVGVDLRLVRAREETQLLAGLDRRPRERELLHDPFPQHAHGHGDGEVGLPRPRGADGEDDLRLHHGADVRLLAVGAGHHDPVRTGLEEGVVPGGRGGFAPRAPEEQVDLALRGAPRAPHALERLLHDAARRLDLAVPALDLQLALPDGDRHLVGLAEAPGVLVPHAQQYPDLVGRLEGDRCAHQAP